VVFNSYPVTVEPPEVSVVPLASQLIGTPISVPTVELQGETFLVQRAKEA
jgi:hypothetical protein